MSMEMWSQLKKYRDGENLDAENMNVPIEQLGDRTAYLFNRFKAFMDSGPLSAVILTGVGLSTDEGYEPVAGNVVYLDRNTGLFAKAKARMSLYDDFKAANSAFTVGILRRKDGTKGDVVVYGSMNLNPDGAALLESDMIESGEKFRPGRYYLSANEAGKITANPNGPLIYVCTIAGDVDSVGGMSGTAIVTPQFLDIGTSHVHRTAVLTARPAGTKSTAGYLPIDESTPPSQFGPLALRFGGTWTEKRKIDYEFYLDQSMPDWPNGVVLRWKEDGQASEDFKVKIPAPDIEVPISHGLTARLSMPTSTNAYAYSIPDAAQRTWEALTFPDDGKGWLDHEAIAIARGDGLRVAVRGRFDPPVMDVKVAFPAKTDVYLLGSIVSGTTFSYDGNTYEFTEDVVSYSGSGGNIAVPLGTCTADSAVSLIDAVKNNGGIGTLAVFEGLSSGSSSGSLADEAYLLVMDGSPLAIDGTDSEPSYSKTSYGFDVGDAGIKLVVIDGYGRVLSDMPVVEDVESFVWHDAGKISVIVYQESDVLVSVPFGTIVSGIARDDDPDAIYDYVLGMDPQVANYWPPVPPKSAALVVNGVEMDNKALVPDAPTVSFGKSTIHWFEDDEGRKPWPEAFERRGAEIDPALDKSEVMHWIRGFQGSTGPVTSLQVKPGSPLKIYGYGTFDKANVGDLEIAADFDFDMQNGGAPGYLVPKRARNGKLIAGPVVERIVGGVGVNIISKAGCPQGQGTVVVALDNGAYGNQFSDIALENAEQAKIGMFPYIRLRGYSGNSIVNPSAFTATVRVPTNLPDGNYALRVTASVFGENGFTGNSTQAACVKFAYNILPDFSAPLKEKYSNLKTGLLKPDSERTVVIPFGHESGTGIAYDGFDPILITTNDKGMESSDDVVEKVIGGDIPYAPDFALQGIVPQLRPGYLVGIRISRAVTQAYGVEAYTGAIGFINLSWSLVSAE